VRTSKAAWSAPRDDLGLVRFEERAKLTIVVKEAK
jgi:hypothetical protein